MTFSRSVIKYRQTPNYHPNRFGKITHLVIHAMAGWFKHTTEERFMGKTGANVSAHYCISKKGEIVQMCQEKDTAYHVGRKANGFTIGVELEDGGDSKGGFCVRDFKWMTPEMWAAAVGLSADICRRNKIPVTNVIGHDDPYMIKLGNSHSDPGKFFPWAKFRAEVQAAIDAASKPTS